MIEQLAIGNMYPTLAGGRWWLATTLQRGGYARGFAYYCRVANRIHYPPDERVSHSGLRLALDSE